jgi:uncharacterized protein (TIGR01777 family)
VNLLDGTRTSWPAPRGRVVIAGGTGFLGTHLAHHLSALGCQVVVLGRHAVTSAGPWLSVRWDARHVGDWVAHLDGATALVNYAGRSVDCIKTPDHCDEILRSRVEATRVLGQACRAVATPPRTWVQMSTAHIYGDPPEVVCDESAAFGYGMAPFVAQAWEAEYESAKLDSQRGVVLRTSFVMGKGGGALRRLALLTRLGLGGTVGSGAQGVSWLHIADMSRLAERGIADESMRGVYIASAPKPLSNRDFMASLRRAMGMPVGLPASEGMVRLAAKVLLRTDPELALYGRYVVPRRLLDEGHAFMYPDLDAAMNAIFAR